MKKSGFKLIIITLISIATQSIFAAEALEKYEYDALGRLTQVKENNNIKTGYCYDRAGNRRVVTLGVGGGGDCPEDEPFPIPSGPAVPPSGLSVSMIMASVYEVHWNLVPDATFYTLRFGVTVKKLVTVNHPISQYTTQTISAGDTPEWIKACNAHGCSEVAYF